MISVEIFGYRKHSFVKFDRHARAMVGSATINRLTSARMPTPGGSDYFPVSFYLAIIIGFIHALLILFSALNFDAYEFDDFWELGDLWPVSVAWSFIALYCLLFGVVVFELAGRIFARRRISLVDASIYVLCACIIGAGLMLTQSALKFPGPETQADDQGSSFEYSEIGPNSLYVQYIPLHASTVASITGYNIGEHAICNQTLEILPSERDQWARKIEPTYLVRHDSSFESKKVRMRITTPEGVSYITDANGNAIVDFPDIVVQVVEEWRLWNISRLPSVGSFCLWKMGHPSFNPIDTGFGNSAGQTRLRDSEKLLSAGLDQGASHGG